MYGIHCAFSGRIGKAAEIKVGQSGKPRLQFSVAVDDRKNDDEATVWVDVMCFDTALHDLAGQLAKGAEAYLEGRLTARTWQASDGSTRVGLTCWAWKIELLGQIGNKRKPKQPSDNHPAASSAKSSEFYSDRIPF